MWRPVHTQMCVSEVLHCLKYHTGINSSHIGVLCQDAYRALHDLLRAMDYLFGTRPEFICQLKLQIAMHVSENLLYDEFGIQGVSAKLSPLQIA